MGIRMLDAEHCGITEEGVRQIAMIEQLEELVLGRPLDDSDEPTAKIEASCRAVLRNMRNLKELEMYDLELQQLWVGKE